ncbi:MAG: hypothetical protein ACOC33_02220 [bacterium]
MIEIILEIGLFLFGASAIWFISRKEKWKKWGYIFGAIGQPFWMITALNNNQWGIFMLSIFYFYSWSQGIWFYWLKPWIDKRKKIK